MPTYEYACKSCGEHLEVVQSFKDDALTECPACGGPLRKVFGNIGIAFKGSGFYRTDSRSDNKTAKATEGKGTETKADSKGSSTETKSSETGSSSSEKSAPSEKPAATPSAPASSSSSTGGGKVAAAS